MKTLVGKRAKIKCSDCDMLAGDYINRKGTIVTDYRNSDYRNSPSIDPTGKFDLCIKLDNGHYVSVKEEWLEILKKEKK